MASSSFLSSSPVLRDGALLSGANNCSTTLVMAIRALAKRSCSPKLISSDRFSRSSVNSSTWRAARRRSFSQGCSPAGSADFGVFTLIFRGWALLEAFAQFGSVAKPMPNSVTLSRTFFLLWIFFLRPPGCRKTPTKSPELILSEKFLRTGAAGNRYSGLAHRLRPSGNQGVPPSQILAFRQQAISTSVGQPIQLTNIFRGQLDAVGHPGGSILIVGAATFPCVKQLAGCRGKVNFAGVLIFELHQAAAGATVAKRLPFLQGHLLQLLLFPKWNICRHRTFTLAIPETSPLYGSFGRCWPWFGHFLPNFFVSGESDGSVAVAQKTLWLHKDLAGRAIRPDPAGNGPKP
jgi:hypothetical protein